MIIYRLDKDISSNHLIILTQSTKGFATICFVRSGEQKNKSQRVVFISESTTKVRRINHKSSAKSSVAADGVNEMRSEYVVYPVCWSKNYQSKNAVCQQKRVSPAIGMRRKTRENYVKLACTVAPLPWNQLIPANMARCVRRRSLEKIVVIRPGFEKAKCPYLDMINSWWL